MRLAGAVLAIGVLATCGGDGTAPSIPAPEPPALVVTFASDTVRVAEGQTVEIEARYRINTLSAPLSLAVSPLNQGAAPEDYELSATAFDIPAGQGVTGTATISLTALDDNEIAEGDEALALRLLPPGGIRAQLDQHLDVTIADAGASPCPGVRVVATPVEPVETAQSYRATTIEFTQTTGGEEVWLGWEGPYLHDENCDDDECRTWWEDNSPFLEVNLVEWELESSASGTKDIFQIEWFGSKTLRFGFRSPGGACEGNPTAACTATGCVLDPWQPVDKVTRRSSGDAPFR